MSKIVENSTQSCLYFESIKSNEIAIGVSEVTLGQFLSDDGTTITKTGGVDLTVTLERDMAVKFVGTDPEEDDYEIRRIDYVEDANVFHITRPLVYDTHSGLDIKLDFWSNDNYGSFIKAGVIQNDNFENPLLLSNATASLVTIEKCTEFTGMNSLFLYDSKSNMIDREESFITGTYDIEIGDEDNLSGQFIFKSNREVSYIVNMEDTGILDLDDDFQVNISGLNTYIYRIDCNGFILDNTQYTRIGNVVTVTDNTILQAYTNYVRVYHFPDQTTVSGYSARFKINYFDKILILDSDEIETLDVFDWYDGFSSQSNPDYYDYRNRETKQNEKVKINQNNKLKFKTKIGVDEDNIKNITTHLNAYLKNNQNFRLIRYSEEADKYEYYWSCRLADGTNFSEDIGADQYNYSIDYLKKSVIAPHIWGSETYPWGDFDWGIITIVET